MGIPDEDIQRVRDSTDIVAVISEQTLLKRSGSRWKGLCPFHQEKSGSFSVNQEEGVYYCFGCGAKGDIITFVRETQHLDFVDAVEHLARKAGVTIQRTDPGQDAKRRRRAEITDVLEAAAVWFHDQMLTSDAGGPARLYFRERGFDGDDVRRHRVGWAPKSPKLQTALKAPPDLLVAAGLMSEFDQGKRGDTFRDRIMFPIQDPAGAVIGFGGRIMPGATGAKYKNTSQTAVYDKSRVLYGLSAAKSTIVAGNKVIVCEGYTDVMGFFKAGLPIAVATCGTALTEQHAALLAKYANRVVLAFDADLAGQNAVERFGQWETKHGLDVSVAVFPEGTDPAEIAVTDPERLHQIVEDAVPFLRHRIRLELARHDLGTPEGKSRAAYATAALIKEHPSELLRDQYLIELSGQLSIDADLLRKAAPPSAVASEIRPSREVSAPDPKMQVVEGPEMEALRILISDRESALEWFDIHLFLSEAGQDAFTVASQFLSVFDAISTLEETNPESAAMLAQAAASETEADPFVVSCMLARGAAMALINDLVARDMDDETLSTVAWARQQVELLTGPVSEAAFAWDELNHWIETSQYGPEPETPPE